MDLYIIPARGGSKRLPGKNIKNLGGKPLLCYSIEYARKFADDSQIYLTSDDQEIIAAASEIGLKVPFVRPAHLATDESGSREVLLHALDHYENHNKKVSRIILLQPTSPFRKLNHLKGCLEIYNDSIDMVMSVTRSKANPFFDLFEEGNSGYLSKIRKSAFIRSQDCPETYQANGSIYVINPQSLIREQISIFAKVKKYVMETKYSMDIDTIEDWNYCEYLLKNDLVDYD